MNHSPPQEALEFRGKSLTPQSPKPLRFPSPSSIPILKLQMDPDFSENTAFAANSLPGEPTHPQSQTSTPPSAAENIADFGIDGLHQPREVEDGGADVPEHSNGVGKEGHVQAVEPTQLAFADPTSIHSSTNQAHANASADANNEFTTPHSSGIAPKSLAISATAIAPTPTEASGVPETPVNSAPPNSALDAIPSGVDFQALLDTLTPHTQSAAQNEPNDHVSNIGQNPALQANNATLPPRPPPQEKPAIHPNYAPGDDIRVYHPHSQKDTAASYRAQNAVPPPLMTTGANGLPPPPAASFQQLQSPSLPLQSPATQALPSVDTNGEDEDAPFPPEVERQFDEFLHDERINVTEGNWDKFPDGSRLFIGNLPTEKVSKRDVFRRFYRYGKLAQISLKQAYGFVQFLESPSCKAALDAEQNTAMRGRKMHLEISKPQNKSGGRERGNNRRRSRSPEHHARGARGDRYASGQSPREREFRRGRDDYRPARSPSPRGYRRGVRSPDRYNGRRRSRSRSPYDRNPRYRDRREDEDDLPLPRRAPQDVPDTQIIVLDDIDRNFIGYVEKIFKDRGLRCDVLLLSPRLSEAAVIRRQILEGVLAVVRLTQANMTSGKLSLQLFDRRGGADNVKFEQYEDLDPHITAELVIRAKQTHFAPAPAHPQVTYGLPPPAGAAYGLPPNYAVPAQQQQQQPQQGGASTLSDLLVGLGSRPELQTLISGLQQQQQPGAPIAGLSPDLARLLAGLGNQQPQQLQQQPPPGYPPQQRPQQQHQLSQIDSLMGLGAQNPYPVAAHPVQSQLAPAKQPDMQEIMAQLAKYQR